MTNNPKSFGLSRWRVDRKVPIGIVIAMILQTLTAIWWAAKLDTRVVMVAKPNLGFPNAAIPMLTWML